MTIDKLPTSITQLHDGLKGKKFSVVDTVDAYLARINKFDPELNSIITQMADYAYKKAKVLDRAVVDNPNAFDEFPLLGVVFTVKDLYLIEGIKTTAGSKVLSNYTAQYTATSVDRLESAGAVIIGKTNLDAWGHGSSGENSDFGPTKNPWNTEFIPGGSSSGSAVSVAADFSLCSLGTDTGGSVRTPASRNNVVGVKPTYGAVPRWGVVAMASSLDTVGHFAKNAQDAEKVFEILKGTDNLDANVSNVKENTKKAKRIGIPKEYFSDAVDSEIKDALAKVITEYKRLDIEFVEVSLPTTKYAISAYYIIQPAEVSSNLARYDGVRYGFDRAQFGAEAKRRIMLGSYVLSAGYYDAYYLQAMKVRTIVTQEFDQVFTSVDALIAPVTPSPHTKLGEKVNDPLLMYLEDVLSVPANLAGIPALALPAGFTKSGLPIGFQLMGPKFSESMLFDLGKSYQDKTDWHATSPTLK